MLAPNVNINMIVQFCLSTNVYIDHCFPVLEYM